MGLGSTIFFYSVIIEWTFFFFWLACLSLELVIKDNRQEITTENSVGYPFS